MNCKRGSKDSTNHAQRKAFPIIMRVVSRTIFIAMLRLYGTRGDTKIWAKIISACAKKCSRDEGFHR